MSTDINKDELANSPIFWHIEPVGADNQAEGDRPAPVIYYDPERKTYRCVNSLFSGYHCESSAFPTLFNLLGVPEELEKSDCDAVCVCSGPPENTRFIICYGNNHGEMIKEEE